METSFCEPDDLISVELTVRNSSGAVRVVERTPYNLISQAIKLLREADDLVGNDTVMEDLSERYICEPPSYFVDDFIRKFDPNESPEDVTELAILAKEIIEWIAKGDNDTRTEGFADIRLTSPEAVGQMLMEILNPPLGEWNLEDKKFLMSVAKVIGPDYIRTMRSVAAFMQKFDEFDIATKVETL